MKFEGNKKIGVKKLIRIKLEKGCNPGENSPHNKIPMDFLHFPTFQGQQLEGKLRPDT